MKITNCRYCGTPFTTEQNAAQFCSKECRTTFARAKNRVYSRIHKYTIQCGWCGVTFKALRGVKYCCDLCRLRATGKINGIAKPKTGKPVKSIEEVARICTQMGLSYGEYMAKYGGDE